MYEFFKDLSKNLQSTNALASIDSVKSNVPTNASYVTLVQVALGQGAIELSATNSQINGASDSLTGVDVGSLSDAYMLHDGTNMQFILENQKLLLSTPIRNVSELRSIASMKPSAVFGYKRGGFVCLLRDGRSIIISTPMPVAKDHTSHYRTIVGATDLTGGWAKELGQFNIKTIY